jgi:hypothetical protein
MKLSEVQKQYLPIEYQRLVDKMLELEKRCDELKDEQEKLILTNLLKRYYQKVYIIKEKYNI